ncbi:MAG TPA: DUF5946 family protein, partial [Flavisolibacter sp.]
FSFIHQHIVDAYTAQTATASTKQISLAFSLIGLYLAVEKNYSGRHIQQVHQQLAKNKTMIPQLNLPANRGSITIADVLAVPPGKQRDEMIQQWCKSVWQSYQEARETIVLYFNQAIEGAKTL